MHNWPPFKNCDIYNFARAEISSYNHRFVYFCDYIIVSKVLGGVIFCILSQIIAIAWYLVFRHDIQSFEWIKFQPVYFILQNFNPLYYFTKSNKYCIRHDIHKLSTWKKLMNTLSKDWLANLVRKKVKIAQIVLKIMGRQAPVLKASNEDPKDLILPAAG